MIEINKIYNEDCLQGIKKIDDASVDVILTDPPYLYLKNQKLDRPFDEDTLFKEFKRVLKKDGFAILFGRGTSFYRWNTKLSEMGFKFKEEIIWEKGYISSPFGRISRIHETISLHTKDNGIINNVLVPYLEQKKYNLDSVINDINRIKAAFGSNETFDSIINFITTQKYELIGRKEDGHTITVGRGVRDINRAVTTFKAVTKGIKERSIIKQGEHYNNIHPTQKPVRLLERLLNLVCEESAVVLDPFSGSGSTACACINTNRNFIGFEIDKEYFDKSVERINKEQEQLKLF